jgi:hypothetical protein
VKSLVSLNKVKPEVLDVIQRVSKKYMDEDFEEISQSPAKSPDAKRIKLEKSYGPVVELSDDADSQASDELDRQMDELKAKIERRKTAKARQESKAALKSAIADHLAELMTDRAKSGIEVADRLVEEELAEGDVLSQLNVLDVQALFQPALPVGLCKAIVEKMKSFTK